MHHGKLTAVHNTGLSDHHYYMCFQVEILLKKEEKKVYFLLSCGELKGKVFLRHCLSMNMRIYFVIYSKVMYVFHVKCFSSYSHTVISDSDTRWHGLV